jgi:hypothetical protein
MDEEFLRVLKDLERRLGRLEAQEHTHTILNTNVKITDEGGVAILVTAGEALAEGNVVYSKGTSGANDKVYKVPTSGDAHYMPIGAVLAAVSADAAVWVVVAGIAKVLPESTLTATRGNVIFASTSEAGRADDSSTVPTTDHWAECGHWLDTGTGNGVLTRAVLHFN